MRMHACISPYVFLDIEIFDVGRQKIIMFFLLIFSS